MIPIWMLSPYLGCDDHRKTTLAHAIGTCLRDNHPLSLSTYPNGMYAGYSRGGKERLTGTTCHFWYDVPRREVGAQQSLTAVAVRVEQRMSKTPYVDLQECRCSQPQNRTSIHVVVLYSCSTTTLFYLCTLSTHCNYTHVVDDAQIDLRRLMFMSTILYENREKYIQIKIKNLMQYHGDKYPLSWYERQSDTTIRGMHSSMLVRYAKTLVG